MQTLRVYPNPYAAFDRNGVPCGICPRDPEADAGGPGRFVGARVDPKRTRVLQDFASLHSKRYGAQLGAAVAKHEIRSQMQVTLYEFMGVASDDPELGAKLAAKSPVELPATKYYKDRIREGALLPADVETAQACRLPSFTQPDEAFRRLTPAFGAVLREAPPAATTPVEVASATVNAGDPPVTLEAELGADAPTTDAPADAAPSEPTPHKTRSKKNEASQ